MLTTAKLAQIHVPYDDGRNEYDDLTGQGFAQGLQKLDPAECPGGTLKTVKVPGAWDPAHPDIRGLCATTRARGHAYRMGPYPGERTKIYQLQGTDLLLCTVNKVGWYEYISEWRFSGDGTMTLQVGATGTVSPADYDAGDGRGAPLGKGAKDYATSHSHNVFWRLNFGLGGSAGNKVEQFDSATTVPGGGRTPTIRTTRTPVTKELAGDAYRCAGGGWSAPAATRTATRARTRSSPAPPANTPGAATPHMTSISPSTTNVSSSPATTWPTAAPRPATASTPGSTASR